MQRFSLLATLVALALGGLAGCDDSDPADLERSFARRAESPPFPGSGGFVAEVTNPYFPLPVGAVWTYVKETDEGTETTVVRVTSDTKVILGIQATVVLDSVYLDGSPIEVTYDWFAQDTAGNVWYLGEESCEFEEPGAGCDPSGSWEAGVDGAEAGIIMWADPAAHKGKTYQQEFYEGEAEDQAKVLHVGLSVSVPAGDYGNCIETMDFTPLEPGAREHKFYCYGIGMVLEVQPSGGGERNELVSVTGL